MSDNPYTRPPSGEVPQPEHGGPSPQSVLSKVAPPAIGLVVVGVLNILLALWSIASGILFVLGIGPAMAARQQQMNQLEDLQKQGVDFTPFMKYFDIFQGPGGIVMGIVALAAGAFIVLGGLKMKNLQSYGLALGAAIVAMIPMLSSCCCIGLPIGIWAIVILVDPVVKNSFR